MANGEYYHSEAATTPIEPESFREPEQAVSGSTPNAGIQQADISEAIPSAQPVEFTDEELENARKRVKTALAFSAAPAIPGKVFEDMVRHAAKNPPEPLEPSEEIIKAKHYWRSVAGRGYLV